VRLRATARAPLSGGATSGAAEDGVRGTTTAPAISAVQAVANKAATTAASTAAMEAMQRAQDQTNAQPRGPAQWRVFCQQLRRAGVGRKAMTSHKRPGTWD
jgi:hypothetical protein